MTSTVTGIDRGRTAAGLARPASARHGLPARAARRLAGLADSGGLILELAGGARRVAATGSLELA